MDDVTRQVERYPQKYTTTNVYYVHWVGCCRFCLLQLHEYCFVDENF